MRRLLAGALRARQEEVRGALEGADSGPGATGERVPGSGGEEELRLLMVRLWPQARRESSAEQRERLIDAVLGLEARAREDLRFLDAWNNAYETLADWRDEGAELKGRRAFLETYADLLEHNANRLAGA